MKIQLDQKLFVSHKNLQIIFEDMAGQGFVYITRQVKVLHIAKSKIKGKEEIKDVKEICK